MNNLHAYIDHWQQSKSNIFKAEELKVDISEDFENEIISRSLELIGNGLIAKATQWDDGFLELTAVDESTQDIVLESSYSIGEEWELEEKLNTWLSEVIFYTPTDQANK